MAPEEKADISSKDVDQNSCENTEERVEDGDVSSDGDDHLDNLTTIVTEEKGLFVLIAHIDLQRFTTFHACVKVLMMFMVVLAVMLGVPSILWFSAANADLREMCEESTADASVRTSGIAPCSFNVRYLLTLTCRSPALFLFVYLNISQSPMYSKPRAYKYMRCIKEYNIQHLMFFHIACVAHLVCTGLVFCGTFILFKQNSDVADLLLNCVALTFCTEVSTTVAASGMKGFDGKPLVRASMEVEELVDSAKGSDTYNEWSKALSEETTLKAVLCWPLNVSSLHWSDYGYCMLINVTRLIGYSLTIASGVCL